MSKKLKSIFAVIIMLIAVLSVPFSVSAAEGDAESSGVSVSKGDRVKCSIYMEDCTQKVLGIDMTVFYNNDCLALDKKSLVYEKFDGAVQNPNLDGYFKFNWTQINNSQEFSSKGLLVSAEFDVISDGTAQISHFITDMYDDDLESIDPYKITYDFTVNGKDALKDASPVINIDRSNEKKLQGSFVNFLDGMGDKNTPNKDNHQSFIADKKFVSQQVQVTEVVDVTKYVDADGNEYDPTATIVVVAIVIILIAIVIILIVRKKFDSKNDNDKIEAADAKLENNE